MEVGCKWESISFHESLEAVFNQMCLIHRVRLIRVQSINGFVYLVCIKLSQTSH